jgi:hypothetical protein
MILPPALEEHLEVLRMIAEDGWKQSLAGALKPGRNTDNWQHMLDELRFFNSNLRRM